MIGRCTRKADIPPYNMIEILIHSIFVGASKGLLKPLWRRKNSTLEEYDIGRMAAEDAFDAAMRQLLAIEHFYDLLLSYFHVKSLDDYLLRYCVFSWKTCRDAGSKWRI